MRVCSYFASPSSFSFLSLSTGMLNWLAIVWHCRRDVTLWSQYYTYVPKYVRVEGELIL